jgi:AraC-like DNA-binding protein
MASFMRGASILGYGEVARRLGLDPHAMLRRFEIDPRVLLEPDLRIPADKVVSLLEASAEAVGCEVFGLLMVESRQMSDYGPISLLLAHQPTLRDTFATMIRYQRMLNQALVLHVEDFPDNLVVVREEILAEGSGSMRQAYELAVGTRYAVFRNAGLRRWRAQSVHFTHGPPQDAAEHRKVFDAPVEFGAAFNGFTLSRQELDAVNPLADAGLAAHAEQFVRTLPHAQEAPLADEVARAIQVLLPFNGASIIAVSDRLGVNRRTLQRRLAEEGAEFSELLNSIRRQHATRYLTNPRVSVAEVAGLVGYSQETSFTRWFAGEFGVSPSVWRTAH